MYAVVVAPEAIADLERLHTYVAETRSIGIADTLLAKLETACLSLERHPKRGRVMPELQRIGVSNIRELVHSPYRIFYEIVDAKTVWVHAVVDGRRNLSELVIARVIQRR